MNHTFSLPAIKSLKDLCHAAILNFKGLAKKKTCTDLGFKMAGWSWSFFDGIDLL